MMKISIKISPLLCLLIPLVFVSPPTTALANFTLQSQPAVDITLTGFDGLKEIPLLQGNIAAGTQAKIDIPYRGLVLLGFAAGQSYPLIIGREPFVLQISDPGKRPTFKGSGENDYLYQSLAAGQPADNENYPFAQALLQAKTLLESTYTIKTLNQLTAKKLELTSFVANNYQDLRHSDMIRRFMDQSLMMHEYVNYHVEGELATAIQQKYQQEVLNCIDDWLKALSTHIPTNEIVNACVAFYYNRSMVTLAAQIMDRFPADAICAGDLGLKFHLSQNLKLTDAQGRPQGSLGVLQGKKAIVLVAEDCPVSLTAAVAKARELARDKSANPLIVAPLQPMANKHRAMARMIRDEKILFIDDERWLQQQPATRPQLPQLFEDL